MRRSEVFPEDFLLSHPERFEAHTYTIENNEQCEYTLNTHYPLLLILILIIMIIMIIIHQHQLGETADEQHKDYSTKRGFTELREHQSY